MLERRLDATIPTEAAFMLEIRKAGHGAGYAPWSENEKPWHATMATIYVHATAALAAAGRRMLRKFWSFVAGDGKCGTRGQEHRARII